MNYRHFGHFPDTRYK